MGEANNSVAMSKDETCSFAMAISCWSVPAMVLKSVIELDILEIIKRAGPKAQLSAREIAAQLPSKNPSAGLMLDRMLRLLATHEVFSCSVQSLPDGRVKRLYGLAPVCEFFTMDEDGHTLDKMCLLNQDKINLDVWPHLKDAVLDGGIAMERAYGKTVHNYMGVDERYNKLFNSTMSAYSNVILNKILETYKGFEGLTTLLDLGGGTGTTLHKILTKYPAIKAINFELPHVLKDAPSYKGVEHVGGDMFVKVPQADAIFMKWILGDWEDDDCVKILKTCYEALPEHGKVIVCEYNIPVDFETSDHAKAVFGVDLLRMATENGGKERTEKEFRTLGKQAGFKGFKVACTAYDFVVMEFYKN